MLPENIEGLRRKYRYLKWRTCTLASAHPVEFAPMKQHIVISAVGGDRVGMVHELSKVVADCGGSISESRMTSLGNEFAMLLLVNGNWHTLAKLEGEFKKLADATGMNIQLRRTEERAARNDMLPYSITWCAWTRPASSRVFPDSFPSAGWISPNYRLAPTRPHIPARRCFRCR